MWRYTCAWLSQNREQWWHWDAGTKTVKPIQQIQTLCRVSWRDKEFVFHILNACIFFIYFSLINSKYFLGYQWKNKLRFVRIYFDTPIFDRITKDRAAKFSDMLSAIGGTMGLLTGFSIISGVEILYFSFKIILKLLKDKHIIWVNIHTCNETK